MSQSFDNYYTMKKTTILFIFNILTIIMVAQSNVRLNNFWEKSYLINPASINNEYFAEFNMAARKQWVNFPGTPTTFFASGTVYIDNLNTQFGLKAYQDQIGYTSTSNIGLTYAYSLMLNRQWHVNLGLGLSFQSVGYDLSQVNSPTPNDPTIYSQLLNENNLNSDLGVELVSNKWQFGLASQNIFSLFLPINAMFINSNYIYTKYRQNTLNPINLGFGVCGFQFGDLYQMEVNLTSYFKLNPDANTFQLGVFYRTWNEMGVLFGIDLTKNLHLSYSYDYNVSGISTDSFGTHEIMFTYNLNKVFKCQNCWY